jgi:hypothetical protein
MTVTLSGSRPTGHRQVPLLVEPALDHYREFADFLATTFDLTAAPLKDPPVLDVDGRLYELVFIGRSGRPFPCGVEVAALVPGLEPLDPDRADADLWQILQWLVAGVGPPWTVEALVTTGEIFRVAPPDAG